MGVAFRMFLRLYKRMSGCRCAMKHGVAIKDSAYQLSQGFRRAIRHALVRLGPDIAHRQRSTPRYEVNPLSNTRPLQPYYLNPDEPNGGGEQLAGVSQV